MGVQVFFCGMQRKNLFCGVQLFTRSNVVVPLSSVRKQHPKGRPIFTVSILRSTILLHRFIISINLKIWNYGLLRRWSAWKIHLQSKLIASDFKKILKMFNSYVGQEIAHSNDNFWYLIIICSVFHFSVSYYIMIEIHFCGKFYNFFFRPKSVEHIASSKW